MAEERTERLGLVVYTDGGDSPSRVDWNETMHQLESFAARDQGTVREETPLDDQRPRRLTVREWGPAPAWAPPNSPVLRSLYRTDDDLVDWPVGGPVHPRTQDFRALEGQGPATAAWRISHPERTDGPTATAGFDGSSRWGGRVAIHDTPATGRSRAALHVGSAEPARPEVFGRVYVRTVDDGDLGQVVAAHAGAGAAWVLREPGGTDAIVMDPFGRTRMRQALALGGSELTEATAAQALTASPSSAGDGVAGVLVHGRRGRRGVDPLVVHRYEPGAPDDRPLLRIGTRDVTIGAADHPDPASRVAVAAALLTGQGRWRHDLAETDAAITVTPTEGLARRITLDDTALHATVPVVFDNRNRPGSVALETRTFVGESGGIEAPAMQTWATVRPGTSTPIRPLALLDGQGQFAANLPWRTRADRPAPLRDTRQPVTHLADVRWVLPGHFGLFRGPRIDPGDRSYTHTFPEMRIRSSTETQLTWLMRLEALTYSASPPFKGLDRVVINLHFEIQVNGGAWRRIDPFGWEQESVGMTTSPVAFCPGDSTTWSGACLDPPLGSGDRFRLRFTARNSDGLGPIRLRRADLMVTEAVVEYYPPPFAPEGANLAESARQGGWWTPS